VSGRAKARREAKAADRIARGKQRAHAELTRRWHLTLKQRHEVDTAYSRAVAELVDRARLVECETRTAIRAGEGDTYEPHCVMQWGEQVAAMDETAGRGKTGWPAGLLQDDCSELSRWFASRVDARRTVRDALNGDAE
jgi:hypothetical protein